VEARIQELGRDFLNRAKRHYASRLKRIISISEVLLQYLLSDAFTKEKEIRDKSSKEHCTREENQTRTIFA